MYQKFLKYFWKCYNFDISLADFLFHEIIFDYYIRFETKLKIGGLSHINNLTYVAFQNFRYGSGCNILIALHVVGGPYWISEIGELERLQLSNFAIL